jgi:hypothetical protein
MLGSDPIAALLGAGVDPLCTQVVWRTYLRKLVDAGASVTMLGPDVVIPEGASPEVHEALSALMAAYPSASQMPEETTGALSGFGVVDSDPGRVGQRVTTYYRHIHRVVGKELAPELLAEGAITVSAGLHVSGSGMVAVTVPDAAAQRLWGEWSAEISGDPLEGHTAPTVLTPTCRGGGIYLFRTNAATAVPVGVKIDNGFIIDTGDMAVPIPPTRMGGNPVTRLGPARMLPEWLRDVIVSAGSAPNLSLVGSG